MPDITMCKGTKCPLKKDCYRFLAKPDSWQSFFAKVPFNKKLKECEFYWKVAKGIKVKEGFITRGSIVIK